MTNIKNLFIFSSKSYLKNLINSIIYVTKRSCFFSISLNFNRTFLFFKIIKNNLSILDVGSAPGSWTQYLSEKSKGSKIMSIDLKEVEKIKDVYHVVGDFLNSENQKIITDYFPKKIDLVVSDMAVNTTGNKNLDSIQTGELSLTAMHFAISVLRPKGIFLSKIFMGSTFNEIVENAKKNFKESKIFKPPSSRKDSKESFIICKNLR